MYVMFYITMILMFFNSMSFLFIWLMLEVLSMMFINLIYNLGANKTSYYNINLSQTSFNYFVYQMTFSLIILVVIMADGMYFLIENDMMLLVLACLLFTKMGAFPYFSWMFKVSESMNGLPFVFMMTIHKLTMLFLILGMYSENLIYLFLLNLIGGSVLILFSISIKHLLILSSMYNLFWFMLIFYNNSMIFLLFYMIYCFSIYLIYQEELLSKVTLEKSMMGAIVNIMIMMIFISSPPFGMFFMKFFSLMSFSFYSSYLILILSFMFILATWGYLNFFYKCMLITEKIYYNNFSKKNKFFIITMVTNFLFYF